MKNLIFIIAILTLASCSQDPTCNTDITFKFIETHSNEAASNITVEIEGFRYNQSTGGKRYLISNTYTTNKDGEITIKGRSAITGWTFEVTSPFYDSRQQYIKAFDCGNSPILDVSKLAKLNITTFDDPEKNYDHVDVVAMKTRAVNDNTEINMGETKTIAISAEAGSFLRVFYRRPYLSEIILEDFPLDINIDEINYLKIGI